MLRQLFDCVQRLLLIAHETRENREDIEALQARVEDLTAKVQVLASEIQRINEREQHEREKFMLKVENALLRFGSQAPPGTPPKKLK